MYEYTFFFKQKTAYEIASCLVGSEMCIRDRQQQVQQQGRPKHTYEYTTRHQAG